MMNGKITVLAVAAAISLLIYAPHAAAEERAHADIKDAQGKSVGSANFRETKNGLLIIVNTKGLPEGLHAVHIHSVGKCEGPSFTSAGGHFNPLGKKHGLGNPDGPHAGDLPDLYVDKDGVGRYEALRESMTLRPGETSIFDSDGSAIVIYATPDDNVTDPTGNADDRIACGVITKAAAKNPPKPR